MIFKDQSKQSQHDLANEQQNQLESKTALEGHEGE